MADLEAINASIDSEIAALRVAARRTFDYAATIEAVDGEAAIRAYGLFGKQVTTIAGLLKMQQAAAGQAQTDTARAAIDAIIEQAQDWKEANS
jgi:hypothetical protein